MTMSTKFRMLAIPALGVLALGAVNAGPVNAGAPAATGPAATAAGGSALDDEGLHLCRGKGQIGATVLTKAAAQTIGETGGAFVPVADASVTVAGPALGAGTDQ